MQSLIYKIRTRHPHPSSSRLVLDFEIVKNGVQRTILTDFSLSNTTKNVHLRIIVHWFHSKLRMYSLEISKENTTLIIPLSTSSASLLYRSELFIKFWNLLLLTNVMYALAFVEFDFIGILKADFAESLRKFVFASR